jgi:aspartate racemase
MNKIGMIGGFGPESTLDYYRLLIETYRRETKNENSPEIIIYSMDINILLNLVANKQWDDLTQWLVNGIKVLHKVGADFAFISANTPHIVFDKVNELSPIPLLSIVDETCNYIKKLGLKKVGLLGTKFTMESEFYQKACNKNNIEMLVPSESDQAYIHNKLMTEIELGNFLDETRKGLLDIIKRMIEDNSIEGIILGCTELPLILTKGELGIPFLNTTEIHVESIIKYYVHINTDNSKITE